MLLIWNCTPESVRFAWTRRLELGSTMQPSSLSTIPCHLSAVPTPQQWCGHGWAVNFNQKTVLAGRNLSRKISRLWSLSVASNGSLRKARTDCEQSHSIEKSLGVVITGGSRGLGYALAREFLSFRDRVVICGRNEGRLATAVGALQEEFEGASISGVVCDVSSPSDVNTLALFAEEKLGVIHRWLNNAGEVTSKKLLADVEVSEIVRVSGTNVVGSLLCCREAIRIMRKQPFSTVPIYHIFNMGFSQWGAKFTKSACTHKATKIALTQLTESLADELKVAELPSIGVHNLSPGLVLTDLLLKDSTPVARRFFNTLAEEPSTAAAILAPRIRAVEGTQKSIELLSPAAAFWKVATGIPQILAGGRFFDKDGNRVLVAGKKYKDNGVEIVY